MAQLYGPPSDGSIIPHELEDAIAADLPEPGTPLGAAIRAVGVGPRGGSAIDPLMTALDTRDPRPLVVAQASDSTGDSSAEWFEITWRELLAEKWPERPGRVNRWDKATDTYAPTETWQGVGTPGSETTATVAADDFSTDGPLAGMSPDVGGAWEVNSGTWVVSGGALSQTDGAVSGAAGFALSNLTAIDGTYTADFRAASTGATQGLQFVLASSGINSGNRIYLNAAGTASLSCTLVVTINGTSTTLATFPAGAVSLSGTESAHSVSVTIDGLNVSATIGAETVTGTLTQSQRDAIGTAYTSFLINKNPTVKIDGFNYTAKTTTAAAPSPLGYLTAYNGAYAGGTLDHNLARLDQMYPERPDALFINHGHNYTGVFTPDVFAAAVVDFVAAFHVKWPGTPIVIFSQNPKFPVEGTRTAAQAEEHAARQRRLRSLCKEQGWGYIPGLEAFMALPDMGQSLVNADGVHPLVGDQAGTGSRLQADTAKAWIAKESLRP